MSYLDELRFELARVGIAGGTKRRIVSELGDHLLCEPASEARLGSPRKVAERFASELRVRRTWRAAWGSFAALALGAGGLLATQVAYVAAGRPTLTGDRALAVAISGIVVLFAPQVAFVAGTLGMARALRICRDPAAAPADLRLVQRRMAIAEVAAGLAFGCLLLHAALYWSVMPWWWNATALAGAALPLLAFAGAGAGVRLARAVTPAGGPPAAGLAADVPARFSGRVQALAGRPWLLAVIVGVPVCAFLLVVTAYAERSLLEGSERAVAEAIVFLACLTGLGRVLGIRR